MATGTIIGQGQIGAGVRRTGVSDSGQVSSGAVPVYLDPDEMRKPEYVVYLHTISKRGFNQPHPVYRNVVIPPCPPDKRYITFMRIQHPVVVPTVDPDRVTDAPKLVFENAKRMALCVCSPDYIGTDLAAQDKAVPAWSQISSGCNLTQQGVFASMNEIPTEEELKKAELRRLAYYKMRYQEANGLLRSDPRKLQEILTEDHHMAAEMFEADVDWHKLGTPKVPCPKCGDMLKEGLAYHYNNGRICVLNWKDAYLAGAVKKEDVPDELRWFSTEGDESEPAKKRKPGITAAAEAMKA